MKRAETKREKAQAWAVLIVCGGLALAFVALGILIAAAQVYRIVTLD